LAFTILLDADALYPVYLRDALLRLAYAGLYQVRWSDEILDEMARNIKRKVPAERHYKIDQMVEKMNRAFPEARVTGYEGLISSMKNHEKDRHVLAAAVRAGADVIVTSNLKDFPPKACAPYHIDVQTPDRFLCHQWDLRSPERLIEVLEDWASALTNPPLTLEELLEEHVAKQAPEFSQMVLDFVRSHA
jgi:predicted nucleic acid-binding protein